MKIARCFEILELDQGASMLEVRQAYKDMVNVWHPDRFAGRPRLAHKAERKIKEINTAYETLKAHFSSGGVREPEAGKVRGEGDEKRATDRTEAVFEAGTRFFLTGCFYVYKRLERYVRSREAPNTEDDATGDRPGPDQAGSG
jgi:DnaJ-class molecular chaperone